MYTDVALIDKTSGKCLEENCARNDSGEHIIIDYDTVVYKLRAGVPGCTTSSIHRNTVT